MKTKYTNLTIFTSPPPQFWQLRISKIVFEFLISLFGKILPVNKMADPGKPVCRLGFLCTIFNPKFWNVSSNCVG